ncbi:hypothetical protein [Fischerella sp. PCC 9605]|uniref:hypothetical protein n=1 Tax=Fischerella sp. PCC 9605 TaxID=1173024 RepID=UPI0004B53855|nr:hypothetical protein [Fischerella sp. PCC 9605]
MQTSKLKLAIAGLNPHTKLCSDIAIRALSPSPVPNWERGANRRGEGSTMFDCNLVLASKKSFWKHWYCGGDRI